MRRAIALVVVLSAWPAMAQQAGGPWPTIIALRNRMIEIYGQDREQCLKPKDSARDYCAAAKSELDAIRSLDRDIADARGARQ